MKNYKYCFVFKGYTINNPNENVLFRLVTSFPDILFFTVRGCICYISETDENKIKYFIIKPNKNKKPYYAQFKCYKLPEYRNLQLITDTCDFVYYHNEIILEGSTRDIKEPNYIGYLHYSLSNGAIDFSRSCNYCHDFLQIPMSQAFDLLENEGIIS